MINELKKEIGYTFTENGAVAHKSTHSDVLDLFALGGALRNRHEQDIRDLIANAWRDEARLALKTIFYLGDVREGQGERRFFKIALDYMIKHHEKTAKAIIDLIPEYTRWDMVYEFVGTSLEDYVFNMVRIQLNKDLNTEFPSLLGKWLKSVNASSEETIRLGRLTAKKLGLSQKAYRKMLSNLRGKIGVVEKLMSRNDWDNIDYTRVPGKAYKIYYNAFHNHDEARLENFLNAVKKGEVKMKSGTLYPHEIMNKQIHASYGSSEIESLELMWRDLPDYVSDVNEYIMPVIDTSWSMTTSIGGGSTTAMMVAKSLGLYLSERLAGEFKDHYITFSERPILAKFRGEYIKDKYRNMEEIVANTNIESVFSLILNTAIKNNMPQSKLPTKVLIFSDMEFDACICDNTGRTSRYHRTESTKTLFQKIKLRFMEHGYQMPQVMFWNLDARTNQFPMSEHESGAALVSGFSPNVLKYVLSGEFETPYETMLKVLESDRYKALDKIEI